MSPTSATVLLPPLAYLIGAIPFAYLIVLARQGIDIRTVGSGNVGATNAARVLGFRYFLVIFTLDFLKGFLPTWGLPQLVGQTGGTLTVLVALATILGHNFPIYLRFRGGKGVATSLGALSALDPIAAFSAVLTFLACLAGTGFVSLSSIVGGLAFVLTYLVRTARPFSTEHAALTLAAIGLLVMLAVRHRKNFARIAAGTEPRVSLRRRAKPETGPSEKSP